MFIGSLTYGTKRSYKVYVPLGCKSFNVADLERFNIRQQDFSTNTFKRLCPMMTQVIKVIQVMKIGFICSSVWAILTIFPVTSTLIKSWYARLWTSALVKVKAGKSRSFVGPYVGKVYVIWVFACVGQRVVVVIS
jgi:hypothetical protein